MISYPNTHTLTHTHTHTHTHSHTLTHTHTHTHTQGSSVRFLLRQRRAGRSHADEMADVRPVRGHLVHVCGSVRPQHLRGHSELGKRVNAASATSRIASFLYVDDIWSWGDRHVC